jgi:uncharacterized membrane-anchored protein
MNDELEGNVEEVPAAEEENQLDGLPEKTMAERAKEIGRDGAYLEIEASDLVKAFRSGDLQRAKMIVIKTSRIELSDHCQVTGLAVASGLMVNRLADASRDESNMTDEQASLSVFLEALATGLASQL